MPWKTKVCYILRCRIRLVIGQMVHSRGASRSRSSHEFEMRGYDAKIMIGHNVGCCINCSQWNRRWNAKCVWIPTSYFAEIQVTGSDCIHLLSPVYVLQHTSVAQNYAPLLTTLMSKKRLDKYLEPIFVLSPGKLDKVDTDDAFDMARVLKSTF